MQKSDSIKELAVALSKAQSEVENADKNSSNPAFKGSKYANLAEIINTVRPVFTKHGLSFVQMPSFSEGVASVETMLIHDSGEWICSTASAPVTKHDPQGVGSAITYLRRYSMAAFSCITQEDDDGNAASQKLTRKEITELIGNSKTVKELTNLWKMIPDNETNSYLEMFTEKKNSLNAQNQKQNNAE